MAQPPDVEGHVAALKARVSELEKRVRRSEQRRGSRPSAGWRRIAK